MQPDASISVIGILILAVAFGGLFAILVWLIWGTIKGFRSTKAGPAEPMAWLRAMSPNHEALPTPSRQAPLLSAESRWSARRLTIYAAQAVAIAGLMWLFAEASEDQQKPANLGAALLLSIIIVAFLTAALTNLWDWTHRKLKRPTVVARPTAMAAGPEHHDPVQQIDRIGAGTGGGEVRETSSTFGRGQ